MKKKYLLISSRSTTCKEALEIGLAYGASSIALLEASSTLTLISCDPFQKDDYNDSGLKKNQSRKSSQSATLI